MCIDFEKEFGNSELSLRYAGTASSFYEWQLHHEDEFMIPAKSGECHGQLILSDAAGWNSEINAVTSFRVLEKGTGSGLNPEVKTVNGDTNIYFENTSDKNIYVEFGLNEKFEVTITKVPGYTVVYNGKEIEKIPEYGLTSFESFLTAGSDYTLDETTKTITLTENGYSKIQKAMVTVIDVSEGNVENTSFVPASEFDQIEFPVYSDAACTKQIPDTSKIKAGDTVYIKLGDIIA